MPNLGPMEIVVIALVVILLFGWKRLPDAARSLGRSARVFKSEVNEMKAEDEARKRIYAQRPQSDKRARASVIIMNDGNVEETWKQVQVAWNDIRRKIGEAPTQPHMKPTPQALDSRAGSYRPTREVFTWRLQLGRGSLYRVARGLRERRHAATLMIEGYRRIAAGHPVQRALTSHDGKAYLTERPTQPAPDRALSYDGVRLLLGREVDH